MCIDEIEHRADDGAGSEQQRAWHQPRHRHRGTRREPLEPVLHSLVPASFCSNHGTKPAVGSITALTDTTAIGIADRLSDSSLIASFSVVASAVAPAAFASSTTRARSACV